MPRLKAGHDGVVQPPISLSSQHPKQPQDQQDQQHRAEYAAKARAAIKAVGIISAAAAKDQ